MEHSIATDESAPPAYTTAGPKFCISDQQCDAEFKHTACKDDSSSRASAFPTSTTVSPCLMPSDSTPSLESTTAKFFPIPCPLELSAESASSSATASPSNITEQAGTAAEAQHTSSVSTREFSKKKYCEFPGCTVQPTFNFPGERGGSHCGKHRLEGQVNTVNKMCEVPGCFVRPSFRFPVAGAPSQRCARHKLPGMIGNSGKVAGSPVSVGFDVADDEFKAATPKMPRGALLRLQRKEMMSSLVESACADSQEIATWQSRQDDALASCIKRVEHISDAPSPGKARLRSPAAVPSPGVSAAQDGEVVHVKKTSRASSTLPSPTPPNVTPKLETATNVASTSRCKVNSEAPLTEQLSEFLPEVAPMFTQRGAPISLLPNAYEAWSPYPLLHCPFLPVNTQPAALNSSACFDQVFPPFMWASMLRSLHPQGAPLLPTLNPWAAAAAMLLPQVNAEQVCNSGLYFNPTETSAQNFY